MKPPHEVHPEFIRLRKAARYVEASRDPGTPPQHDDSRGRVRFTDHPWWPWLDATIGGVSLFVIFFGLLAMGSYMQ